MNMMARHQVAEVKRGYAVRDTKTGAIVGRTYKSIGWAAREATRLNELTKGFKYT